MDANGGTNGDGGESSVSKSTNLNKFTTSTAIDPGKDRNLEVSAELTLGAVEPSKQGSLDVSRQTADNTTSGADIQTDLDVDIKVNLSLNPSGEGSLSSNAQDKSRLQAGGLEDTVDSHVKLTLGGDVGRSGDVDGQSSEDVGGED